ncbi:O-antigen ligase family protein [Silvibacterium sp.]|uniref:O-antigen ligase family protein n=1 Tax=Silvibacterium sp. TaxID=1964179 RepID=UPI0039E33ACF
MDGSPGLEEILCAALLAFFAVQGAVPFIAPNQALETTGQAASGVMFWGGILSQGAVYGSIAMLLLLDLRRVVRWVGAMQWTLGLALLAIASSAWSQFPTYTLRRSVPFAMAGLFGLWFAVRFPVHRQLAILRVSMMGLALATIVMVALAPGMALDRSTGHATDWQGVFTSKNACGRIMVLATAVVLGEDRGFLRSLPAMLLFLFVMAMSGSRGAWVVEALTLAVYAIVRWMLATTPRSRILLGMILGTTAAVAAGVLALHWRDGMALLGRDSTLSGRTQIWAQVWPFVREHPLLGWGYAGFWRGLQGEAFRVVAAVRFIVYHAHNGFLEIALELGTVGLAIFLCSYARAWLILGSRIQRADGRRQIWFLLLLLLVGLYDLDENTLLIYNGLFWVIYVTVLSDLELLRCEDRLAGVVSSARAAKANLRMARRTRVTQG